MSWLWIALWGGMVGLDGTSVIQSMISRPLVAATLTGAILGDPAAGIAVGVGLEIFALPYLPIGAARYPESGVGAVAATFALIEGGGISPPAVALLLVIVFGLGWERVAGGSVILLRRVNGWLMADAAARAPIDAGRVERLHLAAIAIDGARATLVTLAGAVMGSWLVARLGGAWGFGVGSAQAALILGPAIVLAAATSLFGNKGAQRAALLVGLTCGLILVLSR